MYFFTNYGILFYIIQDEHFKEGSSLEDVCLDLPCIIKNHHNRIYKSVSCNPKEKTELSRVDIVEKEKKDQTHQLTFTSIKNFMKIAKRNLNLSN